MTGLSSSSEPSAGHWARLKLRLTGLALGLAIGILLSLFYGHRLHGAVLDAWQVQAPRDLSDTDVNVVAIDLPSLERHGEWPWPRAYMADLIAKIAAQRPKVITLDMMFASPDSHNPAAWAALYPELQGELSGNELTRLANLPAMDNLLAQQIQSAPVVLGRAAVTLGGVKPEELFDFTTIEGEPGSWLSFPEVIASIHALDDIALGHGLMNGPPDEDGQIRRVPTVIDLGGTLMPSLSLETARMSLGEAPVTAAPGRVQLGNITLATQPDGSLPLRLGHFPAENRFSAVEVMDEAVAPDSFTGKIVMVGLTAEGNADVVSTPLVNEGFGIYVQAQAVDAILRGGWLQRPLWTTPLEWLSGLAIVALLVAGGLKKWRVLLLLAGVLAVACPIVAWLAFDHANLILDPFRPLLLGLGAATGLGIAAYVETRAERVRLAETLVTERVAAAENEGELNAARSIQMGMLADAKVLASADPRLDIAATLQPARSVGGDFYDLVRLDADHVAFVVGDVTGKGVPAALYMALSKALTKSVLTRETAGLSAAIGGLNAELMRDHDDRMGVTMVVAVLNCATGMLTMTSAGHDDPLVIRADGNVAPIKLDGGPPLCVVDFDYPVDTAQLHPGDCIVFITDGVSEARTADGELYGNARVATALSGLAGKSAGDVVDTLVTSVRAFEAGSEPSDDLTVLAIKYI